MGALQHRCPSPFLHTPCDLTRDKSYSRLNHSVGILQALLTLCPRFDSAVNSYLVEKCGIHPPSSPQYGLAVHSHTDFLASIAYPAVAEVGVRVTKLGTSSVTYEVALFERGSDQVKAVGGFVHVFVERSTGRPPKDGMNAQLREALDKINLGPVVPSKETSKL